MTATGSSRGPRSDAARDQQALVRAATAAVHGEGPHVLATYLTGLSTSSPPRRLSEHEQAAPP